MLAREKGIACTGGTSFEGTTETARSDQAGKDKIGKHVALKRRF